MKKLLFLTIAVWMAVVGVQAQTIKNGDRFFDGSVLWTASVGYGGTVELEGTDANGDGYRIALISPDEKGYYHVFTRTGAIALRINEMAAVRYVNKEAMHFLAFLNGKGQIAWTMVLTPDNLKDCLGQETFAEHQPVSKLLSTRLMNTKYLARFDKPQLRLMRNEILARHGWKFQSKDLQEYFGQMSWYKPGTNNNAIKLSIIEQTNLELLKSEEATPDEYRTSMLHLSDFQGGLADDGRGPEEVDGVYTVTTEREFLAALGDYRTIVVAKDVHLNLSRVLENDKLFTHVQGRQWATDATAFSGQAPLVVSEDQTDGRQLAIVNMKGLIIKGTSNSSIEVDPRYAFVLRFVNCESCEVRNLTIGHTEYGFCDGGVIGVSGGRRIFLQDCDLYGCGTYGVTLVETEDFAAHDCLVRNCTYGILEMFRSMGIQFKNCDFFNNKEYDLITAMGCRGLSFIDCRFYANNDDSQLFSFDTEVTMSGCEIYHPTENLGTMNMINMRDMKLSPNPYDVNIMKRNIGPE